MKVLCKDLYAELRAVLGAEVKAAGYKRVKGGMLGWTRPAGERHLTFWFQCDKYGWFQDFGSSFTLEFQLADKPDVGTGLQRRDRFLGLLEPDDREIVRTINNRILQGLPPPAPNHPVLMLGEELRGWFMSAYKPEPQPYPAKRDVWLHYAAPEHVTQWAQFFKPRLAAMLERFEARHRAN